MENYINLGKVRYQAKPDYDCIKCAFGKKYQLCSAARETIPCAAFKRKDGTNIIWVKYETESV